MCVRNLSPLLLHSMLMSTQVTYKAKPGVVPKNLVHDHVAGHNPADPVEIRQALGDEAGEPVPDEAPEEDVEEVPVSSDAPSIGLAGVRWGVVVECVHQSRVGQRLGPDHGRRPDQEPSNDAGHAKSNTLGGQHEEHLESPAKVLFIIDLLGKENVCRVGDASLDGHVGHHDDDSMLLHIERAGVEVPLQTKRVELAVGQDLDREEALSTIFRYFKLASTYTPDI